MSALSLYESVYGRESCMYLFAQFFLWCLHYLCFSGSGYCCNSPLPTAFTVFLGQDGVNVYEESLKSGGF